MNLTETYSMTMEEVLKKCDVVEQKMHTDDKGNIQAIEVKYVPKERAGDEPEMCPQVNHSKYFPSGKLHQQPTFGDS